jgi:hypothetical protein
MRFPSQLGYVLSGTAALALLAGCSGGGAGTPATSSIPGAGSQSIVRNTGGSAFSQSIVRNVGGTTSVLRTGMPAIVHHIAGPGFDLDPKTPGAEAVSDAENEVVDIFNTAGKQTAQLTGLSEPQGLGSDSKGNLYVANTGTSQVLVYTAFKGSPKSYSTSGYYPAGVAVDSKGNIGVTEICNTASCGQGGISFIVKGKIHTLTSSAITRVYFGGFDSKGNFFADGENSSGYAVVEVKGGATGKSITPLSGFSFEFPGGVNVEKNGDICVGDQEGPITCYSLKGTTLSPKSTTSLSPESDAVGWTFNSTEKDVWDADAGLDQSNEYKFPAGGSSIKTLTPSPAGEPIGVALNPAFKP